MAKLWAGRRGPSAEFDEAPETNGTGYRSNDERSGPGPRLGEILVKRALVEPTRLSEALLQQQLSGRRIGELLVELGALTPTDLAAAIAEQAGLPMVELGGVPLDSDAVGRLSESVARSVTAIPLRETDDGVEVAIADPSPETRARIQDDIGRPVRFVVAPENEIRLLIDKEYRALTGVSAHVEAFEAAGALRQAVTVAQESPTDDAPVVRVVTLALTQALRDRASDVHFEPQENRLRVRYRIDGVLHDVLSLPATMGPALVSRIKIMAGMNIVERRRAQDGQITMELEGRPLDIRVATAATIWGEKAVLRLLDKSRPLFRIRDLGMPEDTYERYSRQVRSPFGMVVCAGPTGSGKTTTLYATLTELNQPELNIVTIEDPVEYVLPSINQIQVNEAADISFASTLRATMRQDPDVILVGEIRDTETARIAVRSALTGHLVLSSLHATDAASAVHRFVDMGVEPFLVASSVLAVVAQRLVRRICDHCRVPYTPPADELAFYDASGGASKRTFWRGEGCNFCSRSGYQDRIGVYELLVLTDEIKELVVKGGSRDALRALAVQQGMRPLRDEGLRLVHEDVTTISEVVRNIYTM